MHTWAIVLSKPNCEAIAIENLRRQGYGYYWPRFRQLKPDKTFAVKPLFPRYLFVSFDKLWYSIRGTRGVSHVLLGNDGPALVRQAIIDELRSREDKKGFVQLSKELPEDKFAKGQQVKTTEGPLLGLPLIYEGMSSHDRVKVLAEILGRKVVVTVSEKSLVAA